MSSDESRRELLHDLRNILGIVHVAAVDLREAYEAGDDLGERIREVESLAALATEVLRGLGSTGREARPFDLRAAVICARTTTSTLVVGELLVPVRVDAEAGALIDVVLAISHALAPDGERIDVTQEHDGTLLFAPSVPTPDDLRRAQAAVTPPPSVSISITPTALALRPR